MILSKTCDYGIRAVLYIATQKDRQFVPIREISEKLNISFHFLTKILQTLTQKQLMTSFRGPNGGVALARNANEIKLVELITAIDGPAIFEECILGLNKCGDENPCPLHEQWGTMRDSIHKMFTHSTLQDLADKIARNNFRLSDIAE